MLPLIDLNRDAESFLGEYWQKKPCLIRAGAKNVAAIVNPEELAGLACEDFVESRLIQFKKKYNRWSLDHGPFDEDYFETLPAEDWTLLVQGLEQYIPSCQELLYQFSFLPYWRIDDVMASYAPKGGSVGPHLDNYDVFLIQTVGSRTWAISDHALVDETLIPEMDIKILDNFKADETFTVHPGDILYLPPRFAHHGIALDASVTLSVGFRAPEVGELLIGFGQFLCQNEKSELFVDDDRKPMENPGLLVADDQVGLSQLLQGQLSGSLFRRFLGHYLTLPKIDIDPLSESDIDIDDHCVGLEKALGSRWTYFLDQKHLYLFVNGAEWQLPDIYLEEIEHLCSATRFFEVTALDHLRAKGMEGAELLSQLISKGFLEPSKGDRI